MARNRRRDVAISSAGRGHLEIFRNAVAMTEKGTGWRKTLWKLDIYGAVFFCEIQNSSVFLIFLIIYERSHVFTCFFCLRCAWSLLTT